MKGAYYYIYYIRDKKSAPIVTICLLLSYDGKLSKGISICSDLDQPNTKTGRIKACGRALSAMERKCNVLPIRRSEIKQKLYLLDIDSEYKGNFCPPLSPREEKIAEYMRSK